MQGRHVLLAIALWMLSVTWTFATGAEPIKVGPHRQLFVDDYLIEKMDGVKRVLNPVTKHPKNPLVVSDRPWEGVDVYVYGTVLYDEERGLYRMWYTSWRPHVVCYAVSKNGLQWEKPALSLQSGGGSSRTNIVRQDGMGSGHEDYVYGVIYRPSDPYLNRRYKRLCYLGAGSYRWGAAFSGDGLSWKMLRDRKGPLGCKAVLKGAECCGLAYDELADGYIGFPKLYEFRGNGHQTEKFERRSAAIATSADFIDWTEPKMILVPDTRDDELAAERIAEARGILSTDDGPEWYNAHFYLMCGFPYEGMYLGLLCVFDVSGGGGNRKFRAGGEDGPIQVELVSSRDLEHWERVADRALVIPRGPDGAWDGGMIYTSNRPVIVGDEIRIYYGGMSHTHGSPVYGNDSQAARKARAETKTGIGLGTLRLDGWVSIEAGEKEGTLTTKPLVLEGKRLLINASAPAGEVAVAILDPSGAPIPGFTGDDCDVFTGDSVRHVVTWRGNSNVARIAGKPVVLRFGLTNAKLYSFACRD